MAELVVVGILLGVLGYFVTDTMIFPTEPDTESIIEAGYTLAEKSYFEGQKDCINGDIRIQLNSDSTYIWIKSPWDGGKIPSYNPTYLESRK